MLKDICTDSTKSALLAALVTGGLLLSLSARAADANKPPVKVTQPQKAITPKQGATGGQSKMSPYAKMNRQHQQNRESVATNPPPPTASPAARKGKSSVQKKS